MAKASTRAPRELRLDRRQRLNWLRPATFRALVNQFGGAEGALQALPVLSRRGGRVHDIHLCSEEEPKPSLQRRPASTDRTGLPRARRKRSSRLGPAATALADDGGRRTTRSR